VAGPADSLMKLGPEFSGMGRYMALGVQMVVTTIVIAAIGYWLDKKTGQGPVFLIVFFFLGALGGMAVVWRALCQNGDGSKK
jgi:ATP synthase protein I